MGISKYRIRCIAPFKGTAMGGPIVRPKKGNRKSLEESQNKYNKIITCMSECPNFEGPSLSFFERMPNEKQLASFEGVSSLNSLIWDQHLFKHPCVSTRAPSNFRVAESKYVNLVRTMGQVMPKVIWITLKLSS